MTLIDDHVHDCTGPTMTCHCGFKFEPARFCVTLKIHDNEQRKQIASVSRNYDDPYDLMRDLQAAMDLVDEARRATRVPRTIPRSFLPE